MNKTALPDLTARQLQTVVVLAEYCSFIAAASELKTSQPAVTRTIKHVETVLGVKLFDRSTRSVEVTEAGREFVGVATRLLADLQLAVRSMQELAGQLRGRVVVACIMSVAAGRLPRLVAEYRRKYPGIEIHLHEGVHGAVLEDVRNGVADFGITYLDQIPAAFATSPLEEEQFVALVPAEHPFAARSSLRLADLADTPLVSLPRDSRTRRLLDAVASAQGFHLNHVATVTQFATMLAFVREGIGLAVAPAGGIGDPVAGRLLRIPLRGWPVVRELGTIVHADRELSPAATGLMQLVSASWRD